MKEIKKKAYPHMVSPYDHKIYDLNKWYSCEKKIASYMAEGYSYSQSIAYVEKTNFNNKEEREDFSQWMGKRMNFKTASFNFPINMSNQSDMRPSDFPESVSKYKERFQREKEMSKDVSKNQNLEIERDSEKSTLVQESPDEKAFNRYYIGMMRLLLNNRNVDEEQYSKFHDSMKELGRLFKSFRGGQGAKTIKADGVFNLESKLRKSGLIKEAEATRKFAQQIEGAAPDTAMPPAPQPEAAPAPETSEVAQGQAAPSEEESAENNSGIKGVIPSSDAATPIKFEDIKVPDQDPERYKALAGDVDISDAAEKLDEIAGMLADRRVIRKLAEFDIMLDRMGIASMFPELAESQSKLIDAFSYALTRVTKMMGQLSQAQQVIRNTSGKLPGSATNFENESQQDTPDVQEEVAPQVESPESVPPQ